MKRSEVFASKPSKFLSAADLAGKPHILTIASAPLETLTSPGGEARPKTVLYFREAAKALPLNMTNWDSVADIAGGDTDDWPNARIEVYPSQTELKGRIVDCIRVRAPAAELPLAKGAKQPPAPGLKSRSSDMDDSIPF